MCSAELPNFQMLYIYLHLCLNCFCFEQLGVKPGISIKPQTPVSVLEALWQDFDLVLVMSVEPGFGGQQFDPSALDKITVLRQWAQAAGADLRIEVDGGINAETGKLCREAGADVLVAGSYIFKNNIVEAVDSLC